VGVGVGGRGGRLEVGGEDGDLGHGGRVTREGVECTWCLEVIGVGGHSSFCDNAL
jgi:hypothetical protein